MEPPLAGGERKQPMMKTTMYSHEAFHRPAHVQAPELRNGTLKFQLSDLKVKQRE